MNYAKSFSIVHSMMKIVYNVINTFYFSNGFAEKALRSVYMLKRKANWQMKNKAPQDEQVETTNLIDQLLQERGIETAEEKDQFLYPSLTNLQDPFHLAQIDRAKERIFTAIENGETIYVYGDYDADGVTSTTVVMKALQELEAICDFYIPNRFTEGYGLHKQAIDQMANEGATVIITVDNGIANVEEASYAKELGIDLIITDHHEVQDEIPDAFAIIHPKLSDEYSFKDLAGVGVAFQLAYHLLDYIPHELLDLVAIGTIADLVPLLGENRILASLGIEQLKKTEHLGLRVLKDVCKIDDDKLDEETIGFIIGPRINAVGRLENASLAVQLLLTEDETEARNLAAHMEELNSERQAIVQKIVTEAEKQVKDQDGVIILYDENWHEGVLGIAASRLVQTFDRPVILLTYKSATNELKGSARSIENFDLFTHCMKIRDLFTAFGGHAQAAGMTLPFENLTAIKEALNEEIKASLTAEDFKEQLIIQQSLPLSALTEDLVHKLRALAPFGMGNEEPLFEIRAKPSQVRQIGQNNNHLKLQYKLQDRHIDAIGFQKGNYYYFLSERTELSVVGKLQINEWNGMRTVQILIEDLAVDEWQLFDYRSKQQEKNFIPYLNHYDHNLIVVNRNNALSLFSERDDVTVITYESDISELKDVDALYVFDLPYDLKVLEDIVTKINPTAIHLSYAAKDDAFLQAVPHRDEFKWLYAYLLKYCPLRLNVDIPNVMRMKKWSKEKVVFMLKVFLDLQFIKVEQDVIYMNENVEKKSLDASRTYQFKLQQGEIEKVLYYSTYNDLKDWFGDLLRDKEDDGEDFQNEL